MSQVPGHSLLSQKQQNWLTELCRTNGLSSQLDETCFGIEFISDDFTVHIYPLPDGDNMLMAVEIMEFTDVDALENPLILMLLHRLNGLNKSESDQIVTIEDNVLTVSERIRPSEVPPHLGADLIASMIERAEAIRALVQSARDAGYAPETTPGSAANAERGGGNWIFA